MVYNIQDLISYWDSVGVFQFVLPFLLIFVVVFGVLSYIRIFGDNRGIHAAIGIIIGALSVRFLDFNIFYEELFPRLGIGVTIILTLFIVLGLFFTKQNKKALSWVLIVIGFIIFIIILAQSFDYLGWSYSGFGGRGLPEWIITAALLIGILVVIVIANSKGDRLDDELGDYVPFFLGGNRRR